MLAAGGGGRARGPFMPLASIHQHDRGPGVEKVTAIVKSNLRAMWGEPMKYEKRHPAETLASVTAKRKAILARSPPLSQEELAAFHAAGWPASYVDMMRTGDFDRGIVRADGSIDWEAFDALLGYTTGNSEWISKAKDRSDLFAAVRAYTKNTAPTLLPLVQWAELYRSVPDREAVDELRYAHGAAAERDNRFDTEAVLAAAAAYSQPLEDKQVDLLYDSLAELELRIDLERKMALYHYKVANGDIHQSEIPDWWPKARDQLLAGSILGGSGVDWDTTHDVAQRATDRIPPWEAVLQVLGERQVEDEDAAMRAASGGKMSDEAARERAVQDRIAKLLGRGDTPQGGKAAAAVEDKKTDLFATFRDDDDSGPADVPEQDPPGVAALWAGFLGPDYKEKLKAADEQVAASKAAAQAAAAKKA